MRSHNFRVSCRLLFFERIFCFVKNISQFIGNGRREYRKLCSELGSAGQGRVEKKHLLEAEDGDDGAGDHDPDGRHEHRVQHLVLARAGGQQPVANLKSKHEYLPSC